MSETVPIRYIGKRAPHTDRHYGTGLVFAAGQVRNVPVKASKNFLRHSDLFERAEEAVIEPKPAEDDTDAVMAENERQQEEAYSKSMDLADLHTAINDMDFATLSAFAENRYGLKITRQMGLEKGREALRTRIDQYGVV